MKKSLLIITSIIVTATILISCSQKVKSPPTSTDTESASDAHDTDRALLSAIVSLESELASIRESYETLDNERKEQIEQLTNELNALKEQYESLQKEKETEKETVRPPQNDTSSGSGNTAIGFKYIISNGEISITGYEGNDTSIVIPATINGNKVTQIADGAFEGSSVVNVIISDGIEKIGWFAFNDCVRLNSVTVPTTVRSIGYSAFGAASSSVNIFCHESSFALTYARSYGLSYTII